MKYRGKYNLKENLFRGRGMGLLTEVTGDGGRAYEAAVAAHCKGSTNFKGSSLESGINWDLNLVNASGTGKTEIKLNDQAAMGNIKIAGVTSMSYDTSAKSVSCTYDANIIDPAMQTLITQKLNETKFLDRFQALVDDLNGQGAKITGVWKIRSNTTIDNSQGWQQFMPTVQATKQMGSFKVSGEELRAKWVAKGRHYCIIGTNVPNQLAPGDQIGQVGDDDPCALGLGKMTFPDNVRIELRFGKTGSFALNTKLSGSFSGMGNAVSTLA